MKKNTDSVTKQSGHDALVSIADTIFSFVLPVQPLQPIIAVSSYYSQRKEKFFLENLETFLKSGNVNKLEMDTFLKSLDKDREGFIKKLFKVLDRIEDEEKAIMLGKLFRATLDGYVDIEYFKEISFIVEQTSLKDLTYFIRKFSAKASENEKNRINYTSQEIQTRLTLAGLMEQKLTVPLGRSSTPEVEVAFQLSNYGKLFLDYAY